MTQQFSLSSKISLKTFLFTSTNSDSELLQPFVSQALDAVLDFLKLGGWGVGGCRHLHWLTDRLWGLGGGQRPGDSEREARGGKLCVGECGGGGGGGTE